METTQVTSAVTQANLRYARAYSNVLKNGTKRIKLNHVDANRLDDYLEIFHKLGAETSFYKRPDFKKQSGSFSVTGYWKV